MVHPALQRTYDAMRIVPITVSERLLNRVRTKSLSTVRSWPVPAVRIFTCMPHNPPEVYRKLDLLATKQSVILNRLVS